MKLHKSISSIALAASLAVSMNTSAIAAETIKVGILHSLSGTMAISETTLKDTILMLIEDQIKRWCSWKTIRSGCC